MEQVIIQQVKLVLKEDVTVTASQPKITVEPTTVAPSTTTESQTKTSDNNLPVWLIVLFVVASLAGFSIIIIIAGYVIRK